MKYILLLLSLLSAFYSCKDDIGTSDIYLNGGMWTFTPIKTPFLGYELDAEDRWKSPNISHQFIVNTIDNASDWNETRVQVPMAWSSVISNPNDTVAKGDFDFSYFWQYVHKGEYKRTFSIPKNYVGQRIKMTLTSVNFVCWVYVNGQLIKAEGDDKTYTHLNKLPFTIDITDAVKVPSSDNELKIVVQDFTYAFQGDFPNEDHPDTGISYPLGDRCDYYNKDRGWRNIDNGIIGDVILKSVPTINVSDVFIKTDVENFTVSAEIILHNQSNERAAIDVGAFVSNWNVEDNVLNLEDENIVLEADEKKLVVLSQKWLDPTLWFPYNPHLYSFNVTLDNALIHQERFGFRQVKTIQSEDAQKRGFYLNGIKVRLMGESMEPTWKDHYSEGVSGGLFLYNPEYWSYVIDISKELNINTLRTHRGMSLKKQFEIADEKGMMMIAESTINNGNHKGGYGTIENQQKAIRDLIKTHRNHPSIIFWSLANETPFHKEWEQEALKYDNTRPLTATQLVPRNYPSENVSTAACAYSMGLNGYDSEIYHRHDEFWKEKLLYVYEDNACYDQPLDYDRISSVQKGLSIFRGHRTTGYEMIFTFYTWQKLFGQAQSEVQQHLKINWTKAQQESSGYRPDYARMPLLDPWSDPKNPQIINPIEGLKDNPFDFWKRTFSPIAVFDYDYDKRTDISASANPYIAPFANERVLSIHNDDIQDTSTQIEVKWEVLEFDKNDVISKGQFVISVPLASVRQHKINFDSKGKQQVRIVYSAFKSRTKRFEETIYLSNLIKRKSIKIDPVRMDDDELVIDGVSKAVLSRGFVKKDFNNENTIAVMYNENPQIGDFVQFNPWITEDGNYDVLLYIPYESHGQQKIAIQHDTHNSEVAIDFSKSGWIKLTKEPIRMESGKLDNNIKFIVSDTSQEIAIGALKIIKH